MHRIVLTGAVALALTGCGPAVIEHKATPSADHLSKVKDAFDNFMAKNGKLPKSTKDLEPFLKPMGDPAELLKSPADGQPFVILWGVNFNEATPGDDKQAPVSRIYIHEKDGVGGVRHVVFASGVITKLTQDQFDQAAKAKP